MSPRITIPRATAATIQRRANLGYKRAAVAREFGISLATVAAVLNGTAELVGTTRRKKPKVDHWAVKEGRRLMKAAKNMDAGQAKIEQIRSVRGNFADVIPEWRDV